MRERLFWAPISWTGNGIPISDERFEALLLKALPQQYTSQKEDIESANNVPFPTTKEGE